MDFGSPEQQREGVWTSGAAFLPESQRMARWRWLLFAWMARREAGEQVYLRIPTANLISHDVAVTISARGSGPRGRGKPG